MSKKSVGIIGAILGSILRIAVVLIAAVFIYKGATFCYDYGFRIFAEPPMEKLHGHKVTLAITEDMSPAEIGGLLKENGLIRDDLLFVFQYYLSEHRKEVKPGVFEFSTLMTVEQMMEVMTLGEE